MTTEESLKKTFRYNYQCHKCRYYRRLGGATGTVGFTNCCHYMLDTNERKKAEPHTGLCYSFERRGRNEEV